MIQVKDLQKEYSSLSNSPMDLKRKNEIKQMLDEMYSEIDEEIVLNKNKEDKMEDETKGEVSTQNEEDKQDTTESLMLDQVGKRFALFRDYSKEGADTKLKRLIRN